jgi:predicted MFS family arabinose efflux permease
MLLPIFLLSAAGFTVLTTEFIIVGLLPAIARDLQVSIPQAGLLVTLFAFTVAAFGPFLTAWFARVERRKLFISVLVMFGQHVGSAGSEYLGDGRCPVDPGAGPASVLGVGQ